MFTSHSSVHVHKINVLTQAKGKDIDREFGMSYWSWERFIPGNSSIPPGYRTNVYCLGFEPFIFKQCVWGQCTVSLGKIWPIFPVLFRTRCTGKFTIRLWRG